MGRARAKKKPGLRIAVTGSCSDLGSLLLARLEADARVERILALDIAKPVAGPKVEYHRIDLTQHQADAQMTELLTEHKVGAFYHLAFLLGRRRDASYAHEVEVPGTMRVLAALARADVRRLIVSSQTVLYGAFPDHPVLLSEDRPLRGSPGSRFVNDKLDVERQVQAFRLQRPQCTVTVLRFAPVLGPSIDSPVTRFLSRRWVPTLLGFDPLWQLIHEEDATTALHLALDAPRSADLNIVGRGVLPLSGMIRQAGGNPVPLPGPLARFAVRSLNASGARVVPLPLLDYLHFSWVADGARAGNLLGFVARHHARDAVAALRRS